MRGIYFSAAAFVVGVVACGAFSGTDTPSADADASTSSSADGSTKQKDTGATVAPGGDADTAADSPPKPVVCSNESGTAYCADYSDGNLDCDSMAGSVTIVHDPTTGNAYLETSTTFVETSADAGPPPIANCLKQFSIAGKTLTVDFDFRTPSMTFAYATVAAFSAAGAGEIEYGVGAQGATMLGRQRSPPLGDQVPNAGQWHHATIVYDTSAGNGQLTIDGDQIESVPNSYPGDPAYVSLGPTELGPFGVTNAATFDFDNVVVRIN